MYMFPDTHSGTFSFAPFSLWKKTLGRGTHPFLLSDFPSSWALRGFLCINFRRCVNTEPGILEGSVLQPKLSIRHKLLFWGRDPGPRAEFPPLRAHRQPGRMENAFLLGFGKGLEGPV